VGTHTTKSLTTQNTYNNKYQCFPTMYFCGKIYSIPDNICRWCWTSKVLLCGFEFAPSPFL